MPQRTMNQFLRPSHAQHDLKRFHDFVHGYMSMSHIGILIPEHANEYLYIPKIAAYSICFAPKFPAFGDPSKNAQSKSSLQALNNGSTVGGPVAVWMPSQLCSRTNQRMKKKEATLL